MLFSLCSILFFTSLAHASETFGKRFIGEETIPVSHIPLRIQKNVNAVRAVEIANTFCSLVFVSKTGYALTNRHCVAAFLNAKSALKPVQAEGLIYYTVDRNKFQELVGTLVLKSRVDVLKTAVIHPNILQAAYLMSVTNVPFRVVAVPDGFMHPESAENISAKFAKKRRLNLAEFSDFALIQVNVEANECASVGTAQYGQTVHSVGYPLASSGRAESDKYHFNPATITFGKMELSPITAFSGQLENQTATQKISYFWQNVGHVLDFQKMQRGQADAIIFHSALISLGNSGSGLFNNRGQLVGLNLGEYAMAVSPMFSKRTPEDDYARGAYFAVPIRRITEYLRAQLSATEFANVFNCNE